MPASMRDSPASAAAALNVAQVSLTAFDGTAPGSITEVPLARVVDRFRMSLPVKSRRTRHAALLKVLWPET